MNAWCCLIFEDTYQRCGQRGIGVFVQQKESAGFAFYIQFMAIRMEASAEAIGAISEPVTLVTQTGILFCPWCGKNLLTYYKSVLPSLPRDRVSPG